MIFRSRFQDVSIPVVPLTPFIFQRARHFADKPALIDGITGRALTYREVVEDVHSIASGLAKRGFRKGDVFAIYSPNSLEYPIVFHAVSLLGGAVTTINPLWTLEELSSQLKDSGAKYLLITPQLLPNASQATRGSAVREIFVAGEASGATSLDSLRGSDHVAATKIDPKEDIIALPYSSGTTGFPKGVMLTHYNLVANTLQIEASEHLTSNDVLVCVLPFFHIYGMVVIFNQVLYKGATLVILPRFDLEQMLKVMENFRVTFAPLVPPILLALTRQRIVEDYDISALKTIFSAAAPLAVNTAEACISKLGCFVKQGYGMTEASPATHMCPHDRTQFTMGSVGWCVSNTEARIIDTLSARDLGPNEPGEILVRGPQVMKGYLNRPDATTQAIDADGWLHTGDIGYADEGGAFFIVDRLKELIKYKGYQVAPAELEAVLLSHPAVVDAAVIGVADEEAGEVPKGFVVLRNEVDVQEILQFVADRVAPYKKIRKIEVLEQIPKSPSGKILRRLLKTTETQRHKR